MSKEYLSKESLFKKVFNFIFEDMFECFFGNVLSFILISFILLLGILLKIILEVAGIKIVPSILICLVALVIGNIIRKIINIF